MNIIPALLQSAIGCTDERASLFAAPLSEACDAYQINTPARLAAFLAQVGHESGSLRYVREIWGPTAAQARYEGRADLGNTQAGDGRRYCGRGLLQTTGRANYRSLTARLRARGIDCPDFEAEPEKLELPQWAAMSACDYWDMRRINRMADVGDFEAVTRAVNGGLNGYADRQQRYERAQVALAVSEEPPEFQTTEPAEEVPESYIDPSVVLPEPYSPPRPDVDPYTPPPVAAPRPDQEPYTQEAPMPIPSVFIGAAIDAIFTAAPKLLDIFKGSSDNAKRNVEATKMLLEVGRAATGAANEQQIVEALQTSPEAVSALREAVEKRWFDIHNAAEKSQALSRDWIKEYSRITDVRLVWLNMTFIELLTFFFAITGMFGGIGLLIWGELDPSLQGAVITLMLIESVVGVRKAWIGNTPTVPPAPKD